MTDCMECGKGFDITKRTSNWWKEQYKQMGVMANLCRDCWQVEYNIDIRNK